MKRDKCRQRLLVCECGARLRGSRAVLDLGTFTCACGRTMIDHDRNPHALDAFLSAGEPVRQETENERLRRAVRELKAQVSDYASALADYERNEHAQQAEYNRAQRVTRAGYDQARCHGCKTFLSHPNVHCDCGFHNGEGRYIEGTAGHRSNPERMPGMRG